jgi:RNA methyltransferase, TrmH family
MFLAEGIRVVEELVKSPIRLELAIVAESAGEADREQRLLEAVESRCTMYRVPDGEIRRLAGTDSPQGLLVAAHTPVTRIETLDPVPSLLLGLDGVQDPGNFGTLVRSAHAFGADLVLAMTGTVDPWNPKAVRAAAGASFHVHIAAIATDTALTWMRHSGYRIFAADARGTPIGTIEIPSRVALIVGNEGAGVGQAVHSTADERVAVKIRETAESLNVAVAAGILLYELTRE